METFPLMDTNVLDEQIKPYILQECKIRQSNGSIIPGNKDISKYH